MMKKKKLVVIGGGAAGFFCAVNAARLNPDLDVLVLEKSNRLLSKVKVSGGGRCNVTHACFSIADMVKKYPRGAAFLKKSFRHFFTTDTIAWFRERGVEIHTEADGRMFPVSNTSQTIIDTLLNEASKHHVQIQMQAEVVAIEPIDTATANDTGRFIVKLANGRDIVSNHVCVTVGGYPKAGQYRWLQLLGHTIIEPVPSLFTFNMPGNPVTKLMGVSVEKATVKIQSTKWQATGPLLITHWGMSGPAILALSAQAARDLKEKNYQASILVNWIPEFHETSLSEQLQQLRFEMAPQKMYNRNPFRLPSRLWDFILQQSGIKEETRWADLPSKEQHKLVKNLCAQEFTVDGKTTFKEEFVTAGGISLQEIDPGTMESRKHKGLHFAGEILDIDGVTGGFNFQNAWTTGWIAATSIASGQ